MRMYMADHIKSGEEVYYFIRRREDMTVVIAPTKYLKHKALSNRSPNTLQRASLSISFYLNYLEEKNLTTDDVVNMKYEAQHEHFQGFLAYVKSGAHTDGKKVSHPSNTTCNTYLRDVFGWLQFLEMTEETLGSLKVLESHAVTFRNSVGVSFSRIRRSFDGYLTQEESTGRTIEKDSLLTLLDACTAIRDKLLLLLLSETGFRIGELLGVRIGEDIDVRHRTIRVTFRGDNPNMARAKNAEYRKALISQETFNVLLLYLTQNRRTLMESGFLFNSISGKEAGKPLKTPAVYDMLRRLEKKCGIKTTPHMLRHYFANERRKSGWDIALIASALGHRNIETTNRYLNIAAKELEEASEAYFESTKELLTIDSLL